MQICDLATGKNSKKLLLSPFLVQVGGNNELFENTVCWQQLFQLATVVSIRKNCAGLVELTTLKKIAQVLEDCQIASQEGDNAALM